MLKSNKAKTNRGALFAKFESVGEGVSGPPARMRPQINDCIHTLSHTGSPNPPAPVVQSLADYQPLKMMEPVSSSSSSTSNKRNRRKSSREGEQKDSASSRTGDFVDGVSSSSVVVDLITDQQANGSFEMTDVVSSFLNRPLPPVPDEFGGDEVLWVTFLVLAKLELAYEVERSRWELPVKKSKKWIKRFLKTNEDSVTLTFDELLEIAKSSW